MNKLAVVSAFVFLSFCCQPTGGSMFSEGIRLSNPGALRHTHDRWEGATRLQDNKEFVRFESPLYGVRALMKTLLTYEDRRNLNTLHNIISRWAPPTENNTDAYVVDVSRGTGFYPNEVLDMHEIDTLISVAKAITVHENGHPPDNMPPAWYTEAVYHRAAVMALNGE